jgi:hypothetical protein
MACGRDLIAKNSAVIAQLGYSNSSFANTAVALAVGIGPNIFNKNAPILGSCTNKTNKVTWTAGLLDVNSSPTKAMLYLDGVSQGVVPRQLALKKGTYNVTLTLYGYRDSSTTIGIANGATIRVRANMVPLNETNQTCTAGWVMGSFYCDKNDKYGTWLNNDCSKIKKYALTCDYGCLNGACVSNQTQPPANQTGAIYVMSSPSGANVYFNGTYIGVTPLNITNVTGNGSVLVSLSGYDNFTKYVNVTSGNTTTISVTLNNTGNQT